MRADLDRRRFRARCDHCGAPRTHEANACRYCGRSLVAG
jgi:rRNA maturation endonuclease Nob1